MTKDNSTPPMEEQQPQATVEPQVDATSAAAEQPVMDSAEQRIGELELALSQAEQRVEEANDRTIRAVAEMENVRRRAAQDVEKAHKFALEKFAHELLTTVDNLERALEVAQQAEEMNQAFLEGIELTHKNLLSTLSKFGVEPVGEVGDVFNPELHEAMAMQPSTEQENNTLLAVMQKGYTLSGRLLRPAMVMVVKN
ncbi:molecular chaperone GrpE [Pseudidiomarina indica]|uniref:Protein GrpE n=1 Tax=Pseudidiomarina indica TaxID=1159017 RepID=A0A1G6DMI3_9GAMM|nr:nucleotide exchange factor GrpE [Pseudidiomarina indica]SDB46338.1 molecular chaperone GrpE [Pseudidiomarina indica]